MRSRLGWLLLVSLSLPVTEALAQMRFLTGKVTDSLTAEPLTSGQVSVQGTATVTSIKEDGTFTLAAPSRDVTLTLRSIGFKRRDVTVSASQSSVEVALERDFFQLEAIVVTGQATGVERKNLANAVATVSAEQLTKTPTASVEQSLQGKLAGAQITDNSGAPGGGMVVRLRGVTSVIGAFTPLYVVDGVIVSDAAIFSGTNFITRAFTAAGIAGNQDNPINRIADLNPHDIQSVEVLKGAAASAIYGSKASNGVILITTKRGGFGVPQFTVSQRVGTSRVNPSSLQRFRIFQDAAEVQARYGATAVPLFQAANGQTFEHEEFLFGEKPIHYETSASVGGGSETTRYFASGMVRYEGGTAKNTYSAKQSLRLNLDQVIGSRINLALSSEVIHTAADRGLTQNENSGTSWYSALLTTPSFFDLRPRSDAECAAGLIRCMQPGNFPVNPFQRSNPLQTVELFENDENVWRGIFTGRAQVDLLQASRHTLRFVGTAGGDVFTQKNDIYSPPELQYEPGDGLLGTAILNFGQNQNFNVNANAVYTFRAEGGTTLTTQAGLQYETRNLNVSRTASQNLVGGVRSLRAGTTNVVENDRELVNDRGYFAQAEFLSLAERLLLTAGVRADQSSNNGDPSRLFTYPKAAASYRLPFASGPLNEIKLRAAMGFSGNQPRYGQKFTELQGGNIAGLATARLRGIAGVPTIKPERQREIETGFDATLFGSRATLEATIYEKRITDLLLTRTLAPVTGYTTQFLNGGVMRTRGIELSLNVLPVQTRSFQWNARGNFFMTRCKILSLPVPAFRPVSFLQGNTFGAVYIEPGQSCTQVYGNDSLGSQGPNDNITPAGTTAPLGTRVVRRILDTSPNYRFSVSNDLTYKRFRLYFLADRQVGGYLADLTGMLWDLSSNSPDHVVPKEPGALTGAQRATAFAKATKTQFSETTFLKLREVTLTYEVPQNLIRGLWSGARHLRLSLSGRNLLTITNYTGSDPEANQIARSAAEGIPWDYLAYPPSRSFWLSVDFGF